MTRVGTMADWPTNGELIVEELRVDPDFRAEWERTSVGRAVATAIVRYRAEHNLSQRDLAERLGVGPGEVARLEIGDTNPSTDKLIWLSAQLGIEPHINAEPSAPAE
jgi:ribosome-binding protein aMBF1 (putative translation factor)